MNFIGQNLKEWSRQLDTYINDQRPLNLEEMKNLKDIINISVYSTEQLLRHMESKNVSSWMIQDVKNNIGQY